VRMRILVDVQCPRCFAAPAPEAFGAKLMDGEKLIACERCGVVQPTECWLRPVSGANASHDNKIGG
jgi:hypothetical protein